MTFILGQTAWNKGKKTTQETKDKISNSKKGSVAWNKGKKWPKETIEKIKKSIALRKHLTKTEEV